MSETATISADSPVVTLVNVFEVDPGRQSELVERLGTATEQVMQHLPGFVSASIHASLDGRRVTNYAQWASIEHFQAMLADADAVVHMREITEFATPSPGLYRVTSVHRR